MDPNSPTLIASLIGLTICLVAALRKEWPKLDGRIVYLVVLFIAEGLAYLSLDPAVGVRAILLCGIKVAAAAVGVVAAVNTAIDRHGSAVGDAVAAALPIASPLVGELLSTDGPTPPPPDPKPPASAAKVASIVGGMLSGLLFALATIALWVGLVAFGGMVLSVAGCKTLTPDQATSAIDAGCPLISVLDPNGQVAAAVCESAAPLVGTIIADVAHALGDQPKGMGAPLRFVAVTKGGKVIGEVRADLHDAVQAKLDAS